MSTHLKQRNIKLEYLLTWDKEYSYILNDQGICYVTENESTLHIPFFYFIYVDVCIQRPDQRHQTEERRDENILLNCGCLFHLHVTYNM